LFGFLFRLVFGFLLGLGRGLGSAGHGQRDEKRSYSYEGQK
jgi:hypothetical protein